MQNSTATPAADPDLIVALETPAEAKSVKELAPWRTNRGNPAYHYVKPCTYVLADGRRFASTITASKLKDLAESVAIETRWIAEGICRATVRDGEFIGREIRFSIGR